MIDHSRHALLRRLGFAIVFFLGLLVVGAVGYWLLGGGRWVFFDCVYMTVITVATVGYGELPEMESVHGARFLTIVLILGGVGILAYLQATITVLLVEGFFGRALKERRMRKEIEALRDHVVVAGAGSTGKHVIEELVRAKEHFVVIDRSVEHLERVNEEIANGKLLSVHGDATDDRTLLAAGTERARGVVAALTHDKDNLFVTLSARSLNAKARIVAKVVEPETEAKMLKAGATTIVSPAMLGGRRMASEVVRGEVHRFVEEMLADKQANFRMEEIEVPQTCAFVGRSLADLLTAGEVRVLVVAAKVPNGGFVYDPAPEHELIVGTKFIVLGEPEKVGRLRTLLSR
jgi:voltage-gated potassium channel